MEKFRRDFPSLSSIPEKRQRKLTIILNTFNPLLQELKKSSRVPLDSPTELGARISEILRRLYEFKSWIKTAAGESEALEASPWLRISLKSLNEIEPEE